MISNLEEGFANVNELTLHYVSLGEKGDPLLILLHGFPEYWTGWLKVAEKLVIEGFFVVLPDQRGYNLSSKPKGVKNYQISNLVSDVVELAKQLGYSQFILGGHDWGAGVAWATALLKPEHVTKLIIVNVPHPVSMVKYLRRSWRQKLKSWYMFMFQIPWIPEFLSQRFNYYVFRRTITRSSLPETFSQEEIEELTQTWGKKGALSSIINWYRAAFRFPAKYENKIVEIPTLIIWGKNDRFLLEEAGRDSLNYCSEGKFHLIEDATHWVLHERPEQVRMAIVDFLSSERKQN